MLATGGLWVSGTLLGFVTGFFLFRMKQRWCPACGATLVCPDPTYHRDPDPTQAWESRHERHRNAAPAATWHSSSAIDNRSGTVRRPRTDPDRPGGVV